MNWHFSEMIQWLADKDRSRLLLKGAWGLEKESHRVTSDGKLALTPHPCVFGDKLRHPRIKTDFSESQLEFVTPPLPSIGEACAELERIHDEAEAGIGEELLWPFSMPPELPEEKDIPIARYSDTAEGREQELYRVSLAHRYGKKMQMISGLHYNFSFHDGLLDLLYECWGSGAKQTFVNDLYFAMARNFLKYRWLLIYLYGASPTFDPTYESVIDDELALIDRCCPGCCRNREDLQYATSLRVSRYGYSNALQRSYPVSFNSLDEYVQSLRTLLATPSRQYEKIGLYKDGRRIQLNSNVLQKESEFYSSIRLKQLVGQGEKHLDALQRKGVSYAEIRLLDLNPFERTGVSMKQLQFLHTFLLFCLLKPSPPISRTDWNSIHENHHRISLYGRKPGLKLRHDTKGEIGRNEWMEEIAGGLGRVAELLDQAEGGSAYREIVREEIEKGRTGRTLSAVIRQEMDANRETFLQYGIRRAKLNQKKAAKTAVNGRNHDVF